jgi:DNA-binding transcriptional ArsR family regulator
VDPEALDERLRALAHPVRRRLVADCLAAPRTAGVLVARTGLAPASVSEHLKVLRKTGLLVLERDGRFRRYRADPGVVRATARELERLARPASADEVVDEGAGGRQSDGPAGGREPDSPGGRVGRPASGLTAASRRAVRRRTGS